MSFVSNFYHELTDDDPDDLSPPLFVCLIALACYFLSLVPWKRFLRIFGLTLLIFVALTLFML